MFGIRKRIEKIVEIKGYKNDREEYIRQFSDSDDRRFEWKKENERMIMTDKYDNAGGVDEHYFLQDIEMAKRIIRKSPNKHFDIGSRVDGFISHLLSAGIEVTMIDIRPFPLDITGLYFAQGNATDLNRFDDNCINSLSCLHALEHFGLGRYGDPIDKDAWKKALYEYERVIKWGGRLYLSVPIGPEDKVVFNAHRIFRPMTIIDTINRLSLEEFIYIKDYHLYNVNVNDYNELDDYLCGLFVFEKRMR